ncbi:MAG TPA: NlpC/P60 family protein [Actinomycetota bacterium]|jgi:cell wall-associated NlpC family hydrolase|nr:NlpC/P60 family protein [Actinomycetota bacterium]
MRLLGAVCSLAVAVTATVVSAAPTQAQPGPTSLERASDRLSRVTEAYNQAKLKRASLDTKLATAKADLARSKARLAETSRRLGRVVRNLYMHPTAGLETFFQAHTFGELSRGNALAGQVALSADDLLLRIRKARAAQQSSAQHLQELRDEARRDELAVDKQRRAAAAAFQQARSLLARSNLGARDAARRSRLAAAGALAADIQPAGPVRATAPNAVSAAASQIGKPYRWGAGGPDSYDCSGLTMWAWSRAGVSLPHSSRAQYSSLPHVSLNRLAPGDLIFYGSPIHHVGIYKGGGVMVHAPQSGETVREESIYYSRPVGAARP